MPVLEPRINESEESCNIASTSQVVASSRYFRSGGDENGYGVFQSHERIFVGAIVPDVYIGISTEMLHK